MPLLSKVFLSATLTSFRYSGSFRQSSQGNQACLDTDPTLQRGQLNHHLSALPHRHFLSSSVKTCILPIHFIQDSFTSSSFFFSSSICRLFSSKTILSPFSLKASVTSHL